MARAYFWNAGMGGMPRPAWRGARRVYPWSDILDPQCSDRSGFCSPPRWPRPPLIVVVASLIVERTRAVHRRDGGDIAGFGRAGLCSSRWSMDRPSSSRQSLTSLAINAVTFVFCAIYAFLAQRVVARGARAVSPVLARGGFRCRPCAMDVCGRGRVERGPVRWRRLRSPAPIARSTCRASRSGAGGTMPFRAGVVVPLSGSVVAIGRYVGASASGVAALFPIVMTSLAIILQPRRRTRRCCGSTNALPGLANFGFAVAALHVTATRLGSTLALLLALSVSAGCNGALPCTA